MIFKNDEDFCVFLKLGMTTQQAKVYIALSELGQATVKTIAVTAQMDRAEVYRVIPELQKLDLVKKIISTPIALRATPLSEGLTILLQQNAEKFEEIGSQAKQFLRNFKNHNKEKPNREDIQSDLTTGLKAEQREFLKNLRETQTSTDIIIEWRTMLRVINKFFEDFKKALERGVKIRAITNIPKDEKMPQNIRKLTKTGTFEVKFASKSPEAAAIDIVDKKMVRIITLPNSTGKKIEVLRLRNLAVAELAQDYFDLKWQTATTPRWHEKNHQNETKLEAHEPSIAEAFQFSQSLAYVQFFEDFSVRV